MAVPMMILSGVSTALKVVGDISQGSAESKAAKANADAYEASAQAAEGNAVRIEQQGDINASTVRSQVNRIVGQQTAGAGKAGITQDSIYDVQQDTLVQGEMDALSEKYSSIIDAYNQRLTASQYRTVANQQRVNAKRAQSSILTNTIGNLVSGAASAYSIYDKYNVSKVAEPVRRAIPLTSMGPEL